MVCTSLALIEYILYSKQCNTALHLGLERNMTGELLPNKTRSGPKLASANSWLMGLSMHIRLELGCQTKDGKKDKLHMSKQTGQVEPSKLMDAQGMPSCR